MAEFYSCTPHEVLTWTESEARIWLDQAAEHISDMRRIQAVQRARANAFAFMEPDKLNDLLPDFAKVSGKPTKSKEEIISRAEKVKEIDQQRD